MDKAKAFLSMAFLAIALELVLIPVCAGDGINTVYVSNYFISMGETFNVSIDLTASADTPVKGWEFKLRYDPTILRANSVTNGKFFGEKEEFYINGVINNTAGTLINIYSVDLNHTMETDDGTLAIISFTVIGEGESYLELYDVGICNETNYVPRQVVNGSASFRPQWDLNQDRICNLLDCQRMAMKYGQRQRAPFNAEDLDKDGLVSIKDFVMLAKHYGETY